ncbi:unnamed protein product [Kuraishia capsulata CBS 1993]|uniref:FAS1 domain-containing protein n=1 Tax=Kuraishia capsulata CBS 1993 TaxID=1382522 RepID=W6MQ05_9ASCO|nr:uncharacterized protein KUCA_T00003285001 [Kuraishia capsulata CBS 1993]CDK27307.1 unnamed protein product [Kuraishia capsulata CBS 1993]
MRVSTLLTTITVLLSVEARNVIDLDLAGFAAHDVGVDKRDAEPKNVMDIDLSQFQSKRNVVDLPKLKKRGEQILKMEQLVVPNNEEEFTILPEQDLALSTALSQIPGISIFAQYIRDSVDLYKKCDMATTEDSEKAGQLIIFAPSDIAIEALDSKPWSWPQKVTEYNNKKDEITNANIQHFVESHVVLTESMSSFENGAAGVVFSSLNGNKIQLALDSEGFKVSLPSIDEWTPVKRIELVKNGALIIIDKTLDWPDRA